MLWEIGYPDRTAAEFRHGSNWTNDWNYVQTAYFVNGTANNMVWHIKFNLPGVPASGNATLNIAWAGAYDAAIQIFVNDPGMTSAPLADFHPTISFPSGDHANTLIRQGIHDKYGIDHIAIPVSYLVAGTNTVTLVQRRAVTDTVSYVMYDYLDFELPAPPVTDTGHRTEQSTNLHVVSP